MDMTDYICLCEIVIYEVWASEKCAPGRGVCACQVHRWTYRWVEIQIFMIIIPHATRQRNRTAESGAQTTQRWPNHRFVPANALANHTLFGMCNQQ